MDILKQQLQEMQIAPQDIVNGHIHLPELNSEMLVKAQESEGHAMIPRNLVEETISLIDPRDFYRKNREFSGAAAILPVGEHNIHGKGSPLYCSNQRVLQLARRYPEFYIPFASINMTSETAPDQIQELRKSGMVGIKYHAIEGYSLLDSKCVASLRMLEQLGMPLVIHLGDTPFQDVNLDHADPRILIQLANSFPKLRMLATHFATPLHNTLFWIASRYDTIYLDTSEFPCYWQSHPENPYGGLLNPLYTHRIGIHKYIFGTDFPMPTFRRTNTKIEIIAHDTADYLYEFIILPESYLTIEQKRQILCTNFWTFLGKSKPEVISSNQQIAHFK